MALLARLVGPLLARELIRLARGPVLRLAMVAAPAFILLLLLAEGQGPRGEVSLQRRTESASHFTSQAFLLAGVVLAFALPLWICPTIVRERREGGLDLLLTTQLSARELLLGMSGASAAVSACVVASLAPAVSIMALFGGVSFAGVFASLYTLFLEVVCLTGASLHAAASQRTPLRAVLHAWCLGLGLFHVLAVMSVVPIHGTFTESAWVATAIFVLIGVLLSGGLFATLVKLGGEKLAKGDDEQAPAIARPTAASPAPEAAVGRPAMWGPLQIRMDDYAPTRIQFRAVWALYLLVGMPVCLVLRLGDRGALASVLFPVWVLVQPFLVVAAATNPLLGRRPGFFDDLLTTMLPAREIVNGVLWVVQPALLRLLAAPLGLAVLWIGSNPVGLLVGTAVGVAWAVEVVVVGALISLVDPRFGRRIMGVLCFGLAAGVGVLLPFVPDLPFNALLPLGAALGLVALRFPWPLRSWSAAVGFCLVVHFAAACVGAWVAGSLPPERAVRPTTLLTPFYWLGAVLWNSHQAQVRQSAMASAIPVAVSLLIGAACLWRTADRRFDELTGRSGSRLAGTRSS